MIKEYRTAIVTGASRGVGVYIAKALAKEGWTWSWLHEMWLVSIVLPAR